MMSTSHRRPWRATPGVVARSPTRRIGPLATAVLLCLIACAASTAAAHATIVFGTLTPTPNPPDAGEPLSFELTLDDPTGAPVEDAVVRAELRPAAPEEELADAAPAELAAPVVDASFAEIRPGVYRAELTAPEAGLYRILLRDRTFRQEEATQIVSMRLGTGEPVEPIDFLFPPTATGGNLGTWLLWLVAIPLLAGIVVTVLVLRREPADAGAARSDGITAGKGGR